MPYDIIHLPKGEWQNTPLPMGYQTRAYYDVTIEHKPDGARVDFTLKPFDKPVSHAPEDYDFPDKLYAPHWEGACAWGVVERGKLLAAIETCPENWSNRLRVTELWVDASIRRQGVARALMAVAKEQARLERRRAIMLETQTCNVGAIAFYISEGFSLIGFDACAYTNRDIERKEARVELGILLSNGARLPDERIIIRSETPGDAREAEALTRRAFWNLHHPGCNEHLLVRKLRSDPAYLPSLSRLAEVDGKLAGAIYYSVARVRGENGDIPVLTFGPLCVEPAMQGRGVGERLVKETLKLAREAGFNGVVIFGEPEYYPRLGFRTCDNFGITTSEGKNFASFMGIELYPGAFKAVRGAFYEGDVFGDLPKAELDALEREFPPLRKQYFPSQWH